MARIRTVKPEFWEDETIGLLSIHARLLFIATWNLADDEGLLRWSPAYLKASAFMYDDTISEVDLKSFMDELVAQGLVFPYRGGRAQQALAFIINFRKHQNINRPGPGKLPPPNLTNRDVAHMYGRRDNWTCHLCSLRILQQTWVPADTYSPGPAGIDTRPASLSLDHVVPQSLGGSDYPSNIAAAHLSCNKKRCNKPLEQVKREPTEAVLRALETASEPLSDGFTESLSDGSVSGSVAEGNGTGNGTGNRDTPTAPRQVAPPPPPSLTVIDGTPPAPTAQTYVAEFVTKLRDRGSPVATRDKGQAAKQYDQLVRDGFTPGQIRDGTDDWLERDQHVATLTSFVTARARGGRPRAAPNKAQRQLDAIQQTYDAMRRMDPGEPDDVERVDADRRQAERQLPRPANQPGYGT